MICIVICQNFTIFNTILNHFVTILPVKLIDRPIHQNFTLSNIYAIWFIAGLVGHQEYFHTEKGHDILVHIQHEGQLLIVCLENLHKKT